MEAVARPDIFLPEQFKDLTLVVSMSGGKDSTAAALALREAGLAFRMAFADTGWEAPETYEHLDYLRGVLGPIDTVGVPGGMREKILARAGFPARLQRWCTSELKVRPMRAYHDDIGTDTVNVVGIRADESEARGKMLDYQDDEQWGGWVWRPILRWSIANVLAIHARHNVRLNPLYHRGHDRVGCYPCVYAGKGEIRLIADSSPARIDEIRALESECTALRAERNRMKPGHYSHAVATFFQSREGGAVTPIDRVVEWSRTSRGGKQLPLLAEPPPGGCFRWGMCEAVHR